MSLLMFREDYPSSGGGGWEPPEPSTPEVPRWTLWDWFVTSIAVAAASVLFLATCVTWSYTP